MYYFKFAKTPQFYESGVIVIKKNGQNRNVKYKSLQNCLIIY
jgi:hypothetical protein